MAQTLSKEKVYYGIEATATPTRTNISRSAQIGPGLASIEPTSSDICYSIKIEATGNTDVATLTLSSGAVAQTTGTPTITDATVDNEGKTLDTLVTLYGILVKAASDNAGSGANIDVARSGLSGVEATLYVGDGAQWWSTTGKTVGSETVSFTFDTVGDEVTVTVIGAA